ncbi:MAG: GNAT family N-acetyltransferase [Chloroflexi bacterium]|nr:GNAT family N-acetyltransferase [Chloroflexota bacterium]
MEGFRRNLADGLVLRCVRDEQDIEAYAAFNTAEIGAVQGSTCAHLLRHHPDVRPDYFLLVEDTRSGEIVSTTCLIPWRCQYENVVLDVAMLEMVVTHPDYRKRGLVRAQVERFHETVAANRFDLAIIEGIPYYYRQYGYAYALDHWGSDSLPAWRVPAPVQDRSPEHRLRQATPADIDMLSRAHRDAAVGLQLHTLRGADYWRYLLEAAGYPVRVLEHTATGEPVGYIVTTRRADHGVHIIEHGIMRQDVALDVLTALRAEGAAEIGLGWPRESALVQLGRGLGSMPEYSDQWLVRPCDVPVFLMKIAPVLEGRLQRAGCGKVRTDIVLNLFRQAYVLHLEAGALTCVEPVGFVDASMGADGGDLCIPPDAFVRLVMGYRGLDELRDAWPDIVVKPRSRYLLDALFPRVPSYVWMPYLDAGPSVWPH